MGYWLKLYTDVLDDPKYFRLSEEAKLGMYELMLVAKKIENGELTGLLPTIDDIAFHTRKTRDHWEKILPELESIGFVVIDLDTLTIKNYTKRQGAIPSETRVKQYRKKRNDGVMGDVTELKRECNEPVTNRNGEKKREEKNRKEEDEAQPNFFSKFQSVIGLLLAGDKDTQYLKTLIHDYGEEKILKTAEWLRKKDPDLKSMRVALKSIDTAAANWGETKKQMGEFGKEFTADQILGAQ